MVSDCTLAKRSCYYQRSNHRAYNQLADLKARKRAPVTGSRRFRIAPSSPLLKLLLLLLLQLLLFPLPPLWLKPQTRRPQKANQNHWPAVKSNLDIFHPSQARASCCCCSCPLLALLSTGTSACSRLVQSWGANKPVGLAYLRLAVAPLDPAGQRLLLSSQPAS